MKYLNSIPNSSGAYPNIKLQPFDGCIPITEEQAEIVLKYKGFVTITQSDNGCIVEPNESAWEEWKASLPDEPEEEQTLDDRVATLEKALNMILSGVTE